MKKTTLAGLFLAMSVLIGTGAAYADSVVTNYVTGTISSDGAILDSNGNIVGRMDGGVIRRTQVVSMPQPGSSSTVVTRTVQTPGDVVVTKTISGGVTMSDVLADSIISRRTQLASDLEAARARLDAARVAELEARLNGVITVDGLSRLRTNLTYDQAMALAQNLDDVSRTVTQVTETRYVPLIYTDPSTSTRRIMVTESVLKRIQ
ncbi:MAG: hypothetical protein IPP97_24645 [Candidatus Obscuribacter sp.]|jgi:hypothetical protein|nr:hypothetical protein [Candidatus Obscuribacter sp.]MBL0188921.1 hypothetical protein [Candidatus Obscuribacter sp.]MBP6349695.1 hypothetical protein [Candidatus Obscuribacter sp.]MBP6593524.1 hypothetical protein [Candidatus Obscuribacter sp.]MBP7578044.1 hypothetical protein [Candidatus Obscuribacter sp.]